MVHFVLDIEVKLFTLRQRFDYMLIGGELTDAAESAGKQPGLADVLIAATTRVHGLTVVSQNVRHFQPLGVPLRIL